MGDSVHELGAGLGFTVVTNSIRGPEVIDEHVSRFVTDFSGDDQNKFRRQGAAALAALCVASHRDENKLFTVTVGLDGFSVQEYVTPSVSRKVVPAKEVVVAPASVGVDANTPDEGDAANGVQG